MAQPARTYFAFWFALAIILIPEMARASLVNVAPKDLPAYLRSHDQVVVLFNSPDPRCNFCGNQADRPFQLTSANFPPNVNFIRVQWTPWDKMPKEVIALKVYAVPLSMAFEKGKPVDQLGGKIRNVAAYTAKLKNLFSLAEIQQSSAPVQKPITPKNQLSPATPTPSPPKLFPSSTAASNNPVIPCHAIPMYTGDEGSWRVGGADTTVCLQTPSTTERGSIVALKHGTVVGVWNGSNRKIPFWTDGTLTQKDWVESGHTSTPGELWWGLRRVQGKTADTYYKVLVGQESAPRTYYNTLHRNPVEAMTLRMGKSRPPYPHPKTTYTLIDFTPVEVTGMLGGNGPVPFGTITKAKLELDTRDPMQGKLSFNLALEGTTHPITIYLKRATFDTASPVMADAWTMNQLASGKMSAKGHVEECTSGPRMPQRVACDAHDPGSVPPGKITYLAQGYFYGPQSNLVGISYAIKNLSWRGANGPRTFATANGLIILSASAIPFSRTTQLKP